MIAAEFCPLVDECEEYAEALSLAGVPVHYHRYAGLPHGFVITAPVLDVAREALDEIATFLRERLGSDEV
jgi:acetyl esterase